MTPKTLLKFTLFLGFSCLVSSCLKDRAATVDEIETTFEISEDQAQSDQLSQDASDVMDEAASTIGVNGGTKNCGEPSSLHWIGDCAKVTSAGEFPAKKITVDFGTGCTSKYGVTRKGIINITLTDSLKTTGCVATITFQDFYINGYKKEGTITRTNTTVAGSGTRSHNRTILNGKITAPNGKYWLHTCNLDITQTAGVATPCDITDDVFTIAGTRTVTNSQGKSRTGTTQTPLQKKAICANIDQGILKVEGPNHVALIDFGNGSCDNQATISIDGRPARTITLR
jgi:hypothetical protein